MKTKQPEDIKTNTKPSKISSKLVVKTRECEHQDFDNKRDCHEEAEWVCMCCGSPTCPEHKDKNCQFGGMGYIEL